MAIRSYLFVPASRPDRYAKALQSGADAVIIDLEDAVPPADKVAARAELQQWLSPQHPVYVRVNGATTEWHADDVRAVARAGLQGLVLPKAESVAHLAELARQLPAGTVLLPIIETAQGLWKAREIALAAGVERLAFGHLDFSRDLRIGDDDELLYARSQLVFLSRLAGVLPPVDSVTTAIDDSQKLQHDIRRARRLGFGAKLCIHPRQVEFVNRGFLPSDAEIIWAKRVLQAAAAAQGAAVRLEGELVDTPVIERAREVLRSSGEPGGNA